jgi:hypothetical protein
MDTVTAANAEAIANLSCIVKDNIVKSHDTFQKITRDLLWLNVIIYGQSERYMVIRQLEFALMQFLQPLDDLSAAIQCTILGNLPVKLIDPATLQSILRNVTLKLSDVYELIVGIRQKIYAYTIR